MGRESQVGEGEAALCSWVSLSLPIVVLVVEDGSARWRICFLLVSHRHTLEGSTPRFDDSPVVRLDAVVVRRWLVCAVAELRVVHAIAHSGCSTMDVLGHCSLLSLMV